MNGRLLPNGTPGCRRQRHPIPAQAFMPFALTEVTLQSPVTPTNALLDPTFYLDYAAGGQQLILCSGLFVA